MRIFTFIGVCTSSFSHRCSLHQQFSLPARPGGTPPSPNFGSAGTSADVGLWDRFSSTLLDGVDVKRSSATLKIVAQHSCGEEAKKQLWNSTTLVRAWLFCCKEPFLDPATKNCRQRFVAQNSRGKENFLFVVQNNRDWRLVRSDDTRDELSGQAY